MEWRGATELLDQPEVLHGREGARESWRRWPDSWTDVHAELAETIELDGGMLALVGWRARSPAGLEVDRPVAFHLESATTW